MIESSELARRLVDLDVGGPLGYAGWDSKVGLFAPIPLSQD